mgnify:CR=1 FL=1
MDKPNLFQKFYSAINAVRHKISQQDGIQYKKVASIDEIKNEHTLDYHDLSALDLREHKDLFMYAPTESMPRSGIRGWTTNVIWPSPDKMPDGFNPMEIMERAKRPNTNAGATGRGINIAVIDNMLDTTNPEYAGQIKYFEGAIDGQQLPPNKHASMVVGHIAGQHTGMAPDANIYFFTKRTYPDRKKFDQEICKVLQNVIRFNNAQTPENKIHILSCSWGARKKYSPQVYELFDQLEASGVKIILCGSDDMTADYTMSMRDFIPCNNPNMTDVQPDVQAAGQEMLDNWAIKYTPDKIIGIPTNMRTTPMGADGWQYNITGGESSAAPYIAGVYATALSGNQLFMTRPDWQSELNDILKSTATQTPDGNYMINPSGIRGRVSEIVKQMEMDLIKQRATIQHE